MQFVLAAFVAIAFVSQSASAEEPDMRADHPYSGMWVTEDGRVRHELLPNGRYVEARGSRERAYEGRYEVTGTHIEYWDDTGFTADGDFVEPDVLHHGGMILRRTANPLAPSRWGAGGAGPSRRPDFSRKANARKPECLPRQCIGRVPNTGGSQSNDRRRRSS